MGISVETALLSLRGRGIVRNAISKLKKIKLLPNVALTTQIS